MGDDPLARRKMISETLFPLVTARLQLRLLTLADAADICDLYSDWQVARWLSRLTWPFTSASATQLIVQASQDLERGVGCMLAIRKHNTAAFVGTASLRIPALEADPWTHDSGMAILGYAVRHEEQGHGFATEAATTLTQCAFEHMGIARLRATVLRENAASRRVLEHLGFSVRFASMRETPRYGGPPRLGDTYMFERSGSAM
jgi:8-oxo-dGTP diphosphatase